MESVPVTSAGSQDTAALNSPGSVDVMSDKDAGVFCHWQAEVVILNVWKHYDSCRERYFCSIIRSCARGSLALKYRVRWVVKVIKKLSMSFERHSCWQFLWVNSKLFPLSLSRINWPSVTFQRRPRTEICVSGYKDLII